MRAFAPGTVIGNYRVTAILGKGGMGVVYRAEHTRIGRKCAMKVLRGEFVEDPAIVQRFFDEARAANQVGHENVVEVFDFIEQPGMRAYVMELLDGVPLSKLIGAPAFSLDRALKIARQVADALAAVHAAGIVHRDLKPDNVFLTTKAKQPDFVKLLDFGVAKLLEVGDGDGSAPLTQAGMVLGTPAYMAPEQLKGGEVDRRSDIYSFGVILYEMATGQRPFRAKTIPELMLKHVSDPPPRPTSVLSSIPLMLEDLILRCLEKEPARRPRDMKEVGLALQDLLDRNSGWDQERTVVAPGQAGMQTKEGDESESIEQIAAGFDDDDRLFDDASAKDPSPTDSVELPFVESDEVESIVKPQMKPAAETSRPVPRPVSELNRPRETSKPTPKPEPRPEPVDVGPMATPSPATRSGLGMVVPSATIEVEPVELPRNRAPLIAAAAGVGVLVLLAVVFFAMRGSPPPDVAQVDKPVEDAKPTDTKQDVKPDEKPADVKPVDVKTPDVRTPDEPKPVTPEAKVEPKPEAPPVKLEVKPKPAKEPVKAVPKPLPPKPKPAAKPKEVPVDPFAN